MQVKNKIGKFKYLFLHKANNRLKALHQKILSLRESDLEKKYDRNPYQMLTEWGIEVVQYGTLLSIILFIFNFEIITLLTWVIPLGVMRWLIFDLIKSYKKIR